MLVGFLYTVHIVVCVALLPIILLQAGKGGGVSASFGGGSAGSVLGGSRGASTFLTKMTTGAAILFMLTSLTLAYVSTRSRSVIGDAPSAEKSAPAPQNMGAGPAGSDGQAPATATTTP